MRVIRVLALMVSIAWVGTAQAAPPFPKAFSEAVVLGCAIHMMNPFATFEPQPPGIIAATPPAWVREIAETNPKFGRANFFLVPSSNGEVWMVTYAAAPICTLFAQGSDTREAERAMLASLDASGAWVRDDAQTEVRSNTRVRLYSWKTPSVVFGLSFAAPADHAKTADGPMIIMVMPTARP